MLARFTNGLHNQIVFPVEKLFTVEHYVNKQNDRILAMDKESLPPHSFRVSRTQKPTYVMVWAGVTSDGRTPLVFIPQGVKINQMVYRETIIESILKPWAQKHFKGRCWTFEQDSAPAHKARPTQDWCKKNCPDFISSAEWPPSSPDLNPLDYSSWSILEAKACSTPLKSA